MRDKRKPYRIIGAYDSETANIQQGASHAAYPVLHQLGLLDCSIDEVNADNVEEHCTIHLYRHAVELYEQLNTIALDDYGFVPVICCHNLSFDMYGLSPWLDSLPHVRVLAKSKRKPITFTVCDDEGNVRLVIWDTLVFTQQSLKRMGRDCGYLKASGSWDYDLVRTPETPLTDDELTYATRDVYALLAWLGWWIRRNPDIEPSKLGLNVVTKTGIVRERRRQRFDALKGQGLKYNIGRFWHYLNKTQLPKSDDELFHMMACTRGGFTFCSSVNASVPFDFVGSDKRIYAFDATSQHPSQMCSHVYPVDFHESEPLTLQYAFANVAKRQLDYVLDHWGKPFNVAFLACFEFDNLRIKQGSLFEKCGIAPLASARVQGDVIDNEQAYQFNEHMNETGYKDTCINPVYRFGKLVSADKARLYITELTAWEIAQAYDWDDMHAVSGYITGRFVKPPDMALVSVMQFYKAKNEFKHARESYYQRATIDNGETLKSLGVAESIVDMMMDGTASDTEVDVTYLSLKADLNALFGIECTNLYMRSTVLTSSGIDYEGDFGICNAPKNPKAWYQFGQRIVGWSRIAQICVMELAYPYIDTIVNGDTDSVKFVCNTSAIHDVEKALKRYAHALDRAKFKVCARVRNAYPAYYDELKHIGHYVLEFEAERFCASWNKAYCMHDIDKRDGKRKFAFTLAGIPARFGVNDAADEFYSQGASFADVCNRFLGYNVTYAHSVIGLNARAFPEWGSAFTGYVTDYLGCESRVMEPSALSLYAMSKTVNDTRNKENAANMQTAVSNNPNVNTEPLTLIRTDGGFAWLDLMEGFEDD